MASGKPKSGDKPKAGDKPKTRVQRLQELMAANRTEKKVFTELTDITSLVVAAKTPPERLGHLTSFIQELETLFERQFSRFDLKKLKTPGEYFQWVYRETIHAMELIRAENDKDDADPNLRPEFDGLYQRAIKLLDRAIEYVKAVKYKLIPQHKGLLKSVHRINNIPDINKDGLNMHQIKMGNLLLEIRPKNRSAWQRWGYGDDDLKPNSDFYPIYEEFCNLKRDSHISQTRHEMFATRSWRLLASAFQELHIPVLEILPEDDFFDNDTRWTFLDYPWGSPEFLYGKDNRPGMLAFKIKIGGIVGSRNRAKFKGPVDVRAAAKRARAVSGKGQNKQNGKPPIAPIKNATNEEHQGETTPKEKSKEESKEKSKKKETGKNNQNNPNNPSNPKKNKVPPTNADPNPKKRRTGWGGYTMNIVNAAADIEDCLRDSKFEGLKEDNVDRPGLERLQTPTVETRRAMLVAYHKDLQSIIDEIYKRRFGTPTSRDKLPKTSADREAWLDKANRELTLARAGVEGLIDSANTPTKAKKLRLAAYKLKLVRAMYTIGLLSGKPVASEDEIQEGLIGRLDDWILHEQAWNAAEQTILGRPGITKDTYDLVSGLIDEREANIDLWKGLRAEVEKGSGGGYDAEPAAGLEMFIDKNKPPATGFTSSSSSSSSSKKQSKKPVKGGYEFDEDEIYGDTASEKSEKSDDTEIANHFDVDDAKSEVAEYYKLKKKSDAEEGKNDDINEPQEPEEPEEPEELQEPEEPQEPQDPYDTVVTDQQIKNGLILLRSVLRPKKPDAGDYLIDWREERRRRAWQEEAAKATLAGRPLPPWNHLPITDIYAAGGPPNYENIPRNNIFDRLMYMVTVTYWRFYQLRLMEP